MRANHEAKLHTLSNKVDSLVKGGSLSSDMMTKRFLKLNEATDNMLTER